MIILGELQGCVCQKVEGTSQLNRLSIFWPNTPGKEACLIKVVKDCRHAQPGSNLSLLHSSFSSRLCGMKPGVRPTRQAASGCAHSCMQILNGPGTNQGLSAGRHKES